MDTGLVRNKIRQLLSSKRPRSKSMVLLLIHNCQIDASSSQLDIQCIRQLNVITVPHCVRLSLIKVTHNRNAGFLIHFFVSVRFVG